MISSASTNEAHQAAIRKKASIDIALTSVGHHSLPHRNKQKVKLQGFRSQ